MYIDKTSLLLTKAVKQLSAMQYFYILAVSILLISTPYQQYDTAYTTYIYFLLK